jgi:hypothetical protein
MYIVILFDQLVALTPLCLKQLRLCVTNNGSEFSIAVHCSAQASVKSTGFTPRLEMGLSKHVSGGLCLSVSQSASLPAWHIPCQDVAWATAGHVPCLFQFVIN